MESLDLSRRPPRGPRERLVGCMFLARTVDKLRAQLPWGQPRRVRGRWSTDRERIRVA